MWALRWFFMLAVLILLIIFSMANVEFQTSIRIIPGLLQFYNVSVIWIVAVSFMLGMLVTFAISAVKFVRMNMTLSQKDKELNAIKDELTSLRNLPLNETTDTSSTTPDEGAAL